MNSNTILIVEDDAAALLLTRRALSRELPGTELDVAEDGEKASTKIKQAADNGQLPAVILLDWNLPRKHGREVLAEIRQNVATQDLPVVIVTSSSAEPDKTEAFALGASCFVQKSPAFNEFKQTLTDTCRKYLPAQA